MKKIGKHIDTLSFAPEAVAAMVTAIAACDSRKEVHALVMVATEVRDVLTAGEFRQPQVTEATVRDVLKRLEQHYK